MNSAKVLSDILRHKDVIKRLAEEIRRHQPKWAPIFPGDPQPAPDPEALAIGKLLSEADAIVKEPPF